MEDITIMNMRINTLEVLMSITICVVWDLDLTLEINRTIQIILEMKMNVMIRKRLKTTLQKATC